MKENLIRVALRYNAIYLNIDRQSVCLTDEPACYALAFSARLIQKGFCTSEELLHALNKVSADELARITRVVEDVMGEHLNWAPLVAEWNTLPHEPHSRRFERMMARIPQFRNKTNGTLLPCGHLIPRGTFALENYNGCPYCGHPFRTADFVFNGQGSKLKRLRLFTDDDVQHLFCSLLTSPTPLDATQKDTLQLLLPLCEVPADCKIDMKETRMLVVREWMRRGEGERAKSLLTTPTDILRYLWYEKTGLMQIVEPRTLVAHAASVNAHHWRPSDKSHAAAEEMKARLKLRYNRTTCRTVASWLNQLPLSAEQACEMMHPKRGMWVRFIHALRLGEYSRKKGFEHLAELLDLFYYQVYDVWGAEVEKARIGYNSEKMFSLLLQRPGLFARSLFATMLRFGADATLDAFSEVCDQLPARLLLSLGNAAEIYFDRKQKRVARPITGGTHELEPNKLLILYNDKKLAQMADKVKKVYKQSMKRRFASQPTANKTIYIDPMLWNIPVGVGDRATSIQDTSCALMGTRFPVEGDTVRLFLQWGQGLHSQHLDMDLSCHIAYYSTQEVCSYFNLTCRGAKHSGDITHIPEKVGTAEYIELSLPELKNAGAKYVTFTCNAYTCGSLSPNLVVGWMNSAHPMKVSNQRGVAYDPSCVQHMVRISESDLSKGLVFGVLDVALREIIWLEMPFNSQTILGCDLTSVEAILTKLSNKISIGEMLKLKSEAQGLHVVDNIAAAHEKYTYEWALNPAEVSNLLLS